MKRRELLSTVTVGVLILSLAVMAAAQEKYPSKPIHMIVPMAAGGGTDRVARALAEALKPHLPQPVLVENFPGAGSVAGTSRLHASRPDGYTLGMIGGFLITSALQEMTKFPAADFTLIAKTSGETYGFSVPAESKFKSLKEMIEATKADPDKITLGNAGTGALTHLASVAINQNAGSKFRIVPFVGGAKELTALMGSHIDGGVFSMSEVLGHSGPGGKVQTLAVFSARRFPKLPDVPTLAELGIRGIPEGPWQGVAAPKGLPEEVRAVLAEAIRKAVQEASWKEFLDKFGYSEGFLPGKEFEEYFKADMQMLDKLMKAIGLIK
jgi:tripartite-type tricarboxylate transporter receptor subunit TctC